MHKNRRITLHQKIGKGIKFNYITSKNKLKNVSGIQNVIIYVGTVSRKGIPRYGWGYLALLAAKHDHFDS